MLSNHFIPRVPKIGQFIYETSLIPNEYLATSICLQNVIGIALSIYCVVCCLLVMKIIEKVRYLLYYSLEEKDNVHDFIDLVKIFIKYDTKNNSLLVV